MQKSREPLANYLRGLFDSGKVSKSELSRATGIGRSMLDSYLKGENAASIDQLDRIAAATDAEPWELLKPPADPNPAASPLTVVPVSADRDGLLASLIRDLAPLDQPKLADLRALLDLRMEGWRGEHDNRVESVKRPK